MPMAIGDLVTRLLGRESSVQVWIYRCASCDSTFESAKQPNLAACPDCLSNDVSRIETAEAA